MLQLIYEDGAMAWTSWTYSAFYDPTDHNDHQEVDPQYTQAAITRYMSRVSNTIGFFFTFLILWEFWTFSDL